MRNVIYVIIFLLLFTLLMGIPVLAHSGGTNSDGGHYDHSTGEYHYHHGQPAHDHPNGECPYSSSNSASSDSDDVFCFFVIE